jgi:hypothetical protein
MQIVAQSQEAKDAHAAAAEAAEAAERILLSAEAQIAAVQRQKAAQDAPTDALHPGLPTKRMRSDVLHGCARGSSDAALASPWRHAREQVTYLVPHRIGI